MEDPVSCSQRETPYLPDAGLHNHLRPEMGGEGAGPVPERTDGYGRSLPAVRGRS